MTEYLVEDPDGYLIETPDGGLLAQDDEDGYGPIETRPPYLLCCPCRGPAPIPCECGWITLLHPAITGLWDLYEAPAPAPSAPDYAPCRDTVFVGTDTLSVLTSQPMRIKKSTSPAALRALPCDPLNILESEGNAFPSDWARVESLAYDGGFTGMAITRIIDPAHYSVNAICVDGVMTKVQIAIDVRPSVPCEGRYLTSTGRGRGFFGIDIWLENATGLATEVRFADCLHSPHTSTLLDPTGWGAYCDG